MKYPKVLITGGAGFIGSHLTDALIKSGYHVRILDNLDPQVHPDGNVPSYLNSSAEFIHGDVTIRADWEKALTGIDAVFHFAAAVGVGQSMYEVEKYVKVNSYGTALLLDILANQKHTVKKIVATSSMTTYGEGLYKCIQHGIIQPQLRTEKHLANKEWELQCPTCSQTMKPIPTNEDALQRCNSIYAIGKKNQEEMILIFGKAYGIFSTALRFFNVYGTRQSLSNPYTGVAAIFMSRVKNNNPPLINEDGLQSRDFIHVADVVDASIAALEHDRANYEVFNVGSGHPTSIKQVAHVIIELMQSTVKPEISFKFRKNDIRHCTADISKIRKFLGWEPKIRFKDGMKELIAWGEKEKAVDMVQQAIGELTQRGLA